MSKRIKEIKVSIFQLDIIEWIALILSIICFSFANKEKVSFNIFVLTFSIVIMFLSACLIFASLYVRIEYKIKNKKKIPREYYFKKDITSKNDLFKCHIMLIILIIILVLFLTLSIIF